MFYEATFISLHRLMYDHLHKEKIIQIKSVQVV